MPTLSHFRNTSPSKADRAFMVLAGIFIGALVLTNLIAGKLFVIDIEIGSLSIYQPLSCGIIAYPITFLVTDLVSEIYGLKRASTLVKTGFIVSIFVTIIIGISNWVPTAVDSPVSDTSFRSVFGFIPGIVFGSMMAYLAAQFIDVRLFEYWRTLTKGKYLWLRNNGSTILSQLIDTSLVVTIALLIYPSIDGMEETQPISWTLAKQLIVGQYLFKIIIAILDTPFIYLGVNILRQYIGLRK